MGPVQKNLNAPRKHFPGRKSAEVLLGVLVAVCARAGQPVGPVI
jgi:hypothetical protein